MSVDKRFLASYQHGGDHWSLEFYAKDMTDAKWKVENIRQSLTLDGEVAITIRLPWFRWNLRKALAAKESK